MPKIVNGTSGLHLTVAEEEWTAALPADSKDVVRKPAGSDFSNGIGFQPLRSFGNVVGITSQRWTCSIQTLVRKILNTKEADDVAEWLIGRQNNRAEIKIDVSMLQPALMNT